MFHSFVKEALSLLDGYKELDRATHSWGSTEGKQLAQKLMDLKRHKGVAYLAHNQGDNAFYTIRGAPRIALPSTGEVTNSLAHELGHHRNTQSAVMRALQSPYVYHAARLTPILAPAAGMLEGLEDNDKHTHSGVGALSLLASAPQLITEAGASIHGDRMLKEVAASQGFRSRYRKDLLRSFGTYLAPVALAGGTYLGARAIGRHLRAAGKDEPSPKHKAFTKRKTTRRIK